MTFFLINWQIPIGRKSKNASEFFSLQDIRFNLAPWVDYFYKAEGMNSLI